MSITTKNDETLRRGGVAWTWAGVRKAVMADGEGRREVAIIILLAIIIMHVIIIVVVIILVIIILIIKCHQYHLHYRYHHHRLTIGARDSFHPEVDNIQPGQSK